MATKLQALVLTVLLHGNAAFRHSVDSIDYINDSNQVAYEMHGGTLHEISASTWATHGTNAQAAATMHASSKNAEVSLGVKFPVEVRLKVLHAQPGDPATTRAANVEVVVPVASSLFFLAIVAGFAVVLYWIYFSFEQWEKKGNEGGMISEHLKPADFPRADKPANENYTRAWQPCAERVSTADIETVTAADQDIIKPEWTSDAVKRILVEHKVCQNECWNKETLSSLVKELSSGQTRLVMIDGKLVYEENLCMLFVVDKQTDRVIQKCAKGCEDEKVPRCAILPEESIYTAARRCLKEQLNASGIFVQISRDCLFHVTETDSLHDTLPGLARISRKYFVSAFVETISATDLHSIGLDDGCLDVKDASYVWKKVSECDNVDKQCRDWLLQVVTCDEPLISNQSVIESLVLPWTELAAWIILKKHSIASAEEAFGKALPDLVKLLKDGKIALAIDKSTGDLVCLEDCVVCVIKSPGGFTLFEDENDVWSLSDEVVDGAALPVELPASRKFSFESPWQAALRFLHNNMQLSHPALQLSTKVYDKNHCGLVEMSELNPNALQWNPDERTPKCQLRLFLIEGEIKKAAATIDIAG